MVYKFPSPNYQSSMVLVLTRKYITTCITKDLQLHQETTPYALTFLYTRYKPKTYAVEIQVLIILTTSLKIATAQTVN